MAFIKQNLKNSLRSIMDPDYSLFQGFPGNNIEVATVWTDIVDSYASIVTPPSLSSFAARNAFYSKMLTVNSQSDGLIILPQAFLEYAVILGQGMQPNFTATPPPMPLDISSVISLGLSGANGNLTSELLSSLIDSWFRTGLAVNNSSGAIVNWN